MQRGDWLLASEPLEPTDRITIEITPEVNLKDSQPCAYLSCSKAARRVSSPCLKAKMQ